MTKNYQEQPKGLSPLQAELFQLLGMESPKPIHPKLVLIFGYPLTAIITQLLFWKGKEKRKDGLIYKTEKEFIDELGLTSARQKLAIKKGMSFGFLDVKRKGIPAKRHYSLNYKRLILAVIEEADRKGIVLSKSWFKLAQKNGYNKGDKRLTNTDKTQDNTTEKKSTESTGDILSKRYGIR